jgi:hypothetical protein
LKLIYQISLKKITSPDFGDFIVCAGALFGYLGFVSGNENVKKFTGGKEFLIQMNHLMKENNQHKISLVYNLVLMIKVFEDKWMIDCPHESSQMINLLIQHMGDNLKSLETLDSSWALFMIFDLFEKDMYPWFDVIMTKSINILKKLKSCENPQISFLIFSIHFMLDTFPYFCGKYLETPEFLELILHYSMVILII